MSALSISSRLSNSRLVKSPARNPNLAAEYEAGTAPTLKAKRPFEDRYRNRYPDGFGPYGERARQRRVYDRAKSRQRKRMMGGDGRLPNTIRNWFTEGERAVLSVIAGEVKRHGKCDLMVERVAAKAGVSVRLVQYTLAMASWSSDDMRKLPEKERPPLLIVVEYRPRRGAPSLPNVIKIVSREWINWLSYRPSEAPASEAAEDGDWRVFDPYAGQMPRVLGIGCRKKHTSENPINANTKDSSQAIDPADGWQRLRRGLPLQGAYEREGWRGRVMPETQGGNRGNSPVGGRDNASY